MFNQVQLRVIDFCAEECRRQETEADAVAAMLRAWEYIADMDILRPGSYNYENIIKDVHHLVMGSDGFNAVHRGYRRMQVYFKDLVNSPLDWKLIPQQMDWLCQNIRDIDPQVFFDRFEFIHPFKDGNGRTGQIMANALARTLENPQFFEFKGVTAHV